MNQPRRLRRLLGWLLLIALGISAPVAGVLFSQSVSRPNAVPPSREPSAAAAGPGVVCFGYVDLEHGVAALYPLQPGRVAEMLVRENEKVPEGKVLLRLEDGLAKARVAEAQAGLEAAQAQLAQARQLPSLHKSRISQQENALEAVRYRLSAARRLLERKRKLLDSKLISPEEVSVSEDQIKEFEALERVEKQRLADLQSQEPANDVRRAEKEVEVIQARLEQARLGLEECSLKAPKAGSVLRIMAGPGDVLGAAPKQPALMFAVDGNFVVRAEVEQEFAGRVAVGQTVVVQDEASSDVSWRGKVERVANWYSQRRAIMSEPFQLNDVRTVECVISLEPGPMPLRIGQRVRVLIGSVAR